MKLRINLDFYANTNHIALIAIDPVIQEAYGKITTHVPGVQLEDNEFIVKTYAENDPWAHDFVKEHPEWFLPTGKSAQVGPWSSCPIYRVTKLFINEQFEYSYNKRSDMYDAHEYLWSLYDKYCSNPV